MTLWFDVEDLITHFRHDSRPTGIQRLTFEIYREVWRAAGASGDAKFCRHGATPDEYIVVDWPKLEAGILAGSAGRPEPEPAGDGQGFVETVPFELNFRGKLHRYLYPRITPTIREPLGVLYRSQKQWLLALRDLFKALLPVLSKPGQPPARLGEVTIRLTTDPVEFAPDDLFVALGASWGQLNAAAGRHVQQRYGLRFAVLIHDLIPELYPEWTSREGLPAFRAWLRDVVPYADEIFAVSRHSAHDLVRRMAECNLPVPTPVVLPVGHRQRDFAASEANPFDRPYVLFVSTIEVRKNHALLFRVWRRLLSTMPAAAVPYLVFAGKTAWLTADLMVQLENADWLNGWIKRVESPSEPALAALYAHCAFTVFPSLYEGWGLPVTESLSFGKTVAASNRAAIPEAGGDFCCYFDPENVGEATDVIRGLIEHPERVRQLEARIAGHFRPPSWAETAAVLLARLQAPPPAARPASESAAEPDSGVMAVA